MTNPVEPKGSGLPKNEQLRQPEPNVIDQRQQQIDPAGHHRADPNNRPDANRKQPGGSSGDDDRASEETKP